MSDRVSIAVLGMGAMGSRIARRFVDAGHSVIVWNRTLEKTEPLEAAGAAVASSPADAARRSDVVITMLASPAALRAVVAGVGGVLDAMSPSSTLVEMSTVGPDAIAWLRDEVSDGRRLIDAPVLGSLSEVEEGKLKIFVGGSRELFDEHSKLLSTLGTPFHVGPLGTGAAAKLVANLTLLATLGVVGEAVELADALGIERKAAWRVLGSTPLAAQAKRRRPVLEGEDVPKRFALKLARKDAELVVGAARGAGADLRIAAAARSWFDDAVAHGLGERDYSEILRHIVGTARHRP